MVLKKNTAESKGMKYGIPALDAVRKFSNEAWLFLAKPLDFLHLCMGGDIHKINTNLILLTGPGFKIHHQTFRIDRLPIFFIFPLESTFKNKLKSKNSEFLAHSLILNSNLKSQR